MNMNRWILSAALLLSGLALAQGTVPDRVSFVARLTNTTGQPVTGNHAVQFSLFDVNTGGTALWSETYGSATFTADGLGFFELGSTTALTTSVFDGRQLYLQVTVDSTALTPRVSVVSVPYAIRATTAATAATATRLGTLAEADVQRRVTGTCTAGNAIRSVAADGTVTCEAVAAATDLTVGRLPTNPGTSCRDIKTRVPSAMDGIYLVDTDGSTGNPPFQVYCDMTRDGGGWTLIMRVWYQSGLAGNTAGVGTPHEANSPKTEPYKLADAVVNAVIGTDRNFDILVDSMYRNTTYSSANNEYIIVRNYTGTYAYNGVVPESTTATVFESFRATDNVLAWRGRLQCGNVGAYGINCYNLLTTPNPIGAQNPQGSLGCLVPLSTSTSAGWHHLYQGDTNTDTYIYICSGAQHTSGHSNVHRWWVR